MPRAPKRSRIEAALTALSGALGEIGAPWMVIGGIAVISHGVQRMTTDIDAVIQGDAVSIRALIEVLRTHQITPRIQDAESFAASNLVLLTRHLPTEVDLDLSFGWTAFEHEALTARAQTHYGRVSAPMARVEDLLIFKAMANRPRDVDDAITLLTMYPRVDMERVRTRIAEFAELADAPELMQGLERILDAAAMMPAKRALADPLSAHRARSPAAKKPVARSPAAKKPVAKKPVAKKPVRRSAIKRRR